MTDSEKESMKKQSGGGGKPGVRKGKKMQRHRKEDRKELLAQNGKKNKVKDGGVAEVEKKGPRERQKGRGENKETTRPTCWVHAGI